MPLLDRSKESQQNHFLRWNGDVASELLLVSLQGNEALCTPYWYELRSLTRLNESRLSHWHGRQVSCRIGDGQQDLPHRYLHGVITHIRYAQRAQNEAECILTLEPSLALLKLGRNTRVWQNIAVPDLVSILLNEQGISQPDMQLHDNYPKREYCVQYRESTFNFIHRLLEEEGIYYFFRHTESGHTLVLADHPATHSDIQGRTLSWHHDNRILARGSVEHWASTTSLLPAGVSLQGYSMLQATAVRNQQMASNSQPHVDGITFSDITPEGERAQLSRHAQNMMAIHEANTRYFDTRTRAHWLSSGEIFTLTGHPSGEMSYRIQAMETEAANNFDSDTSSYCCQLQAMSNDQRWRPPHQHLPPEIPGVLTATVVGPDSEEIHTDEYGRIKIQFPWDNKNPSNDNSSCWVRVAQPWAGGKFGGQFIPRVGSEVLVSFIQGHPDHPLVTGAVYNGQNKPPFSLPGEKNESGFVTRSTTKGSIEDGHRLSFNDKKGEEKLTISTQKDLALTIKNDAICKIAANRHTELSKGNDQLIIREGNMLFTLEKGNLHQNVTGNVTTGLKNGDYTLKVSGGSGNIQTDKTLTLESMQSIELKVGSNKISLSASGISISGTMIKIEGSGTAELKGAMTTVSGSGMAQISGGIINIG